MSLHAVKILGIKVNTSSKKEVLEYLEKNTKNPFILVTPNPEQVVLAQKDKRFANILNQADVAIPDGVGVAWATRAKRIPGVELMEGLVEQAAIRSIPIGLIGGWNKVAVEAFECLKRTYPSLNGWALEPEELEIEKIAQKIQKTGVGMVFVGLGAPKQEYFIEALGMSLRRSRAKSRETRQSLVLMSVGGSFDIIAGRIPRAPRLFQALGLEWLWRLFREPWRLKRQRALVKFIWLVFKERVIKI